MSVNTVKIIENLEVYSETCCELCNEIVHNHIDCRACGKSYAATDTYCDAYEEQEIECECGAVYKLLEGSWYSDNKVELTIKS